MTPRVSVDVARVKQEHSLQLALSSKTQTISCNLGLQSASCACGLWEETGILWEIGRASKFKREKPRELKPPAPLPINMHFSSSVVDNCLLKQ